MSSFLAEACAAAWTRVEAAAARTPLARLQAAPAPTARFAAALAGPEVAVIAEIKRASPSRGALAPIPDAAALARSYAAGGAAAVSVLTEPRWFKGELDDLRAASVAVDLPVLRKDFVVDGYQIWEARAAGAAAVLLIVAALDADALVGLLKTSAEAGLEALVEVHTVEEAEHAVDALAQAGTPQPVVGVNARDLTSLEVDPARFAGVRDRLPAGALAVAESGVAGPEDVRRLAGLGADAVLVGEHVTGAADPAAAVAALVAAGADR